MIKVSLKEAEGHLGELIEEAAAGQEVVITGAGSATVRLVPMLEPVPAEPTTTIGHSLDHLFGSWTPEEEAEFLESIQVFERIDESFWK